MKRNNVVTNAITQKESPQSCTSEGFRLIQVESGNVLGYLSGLLPVQPFVDLIQDNVYHNRSEKRNNVVYQCHHLLPDGRSRRFYYTIL